MTVKDAVRIIGDKVRYGTVTVHTYDPPNVPGFTSNIASVFGQPFSQTAELLEALTYIDEGPEFKDRSIRVRRVKTLRGRTEGSKGEVIPSQILVTISYLK